MTDVNVALGRLDEVLQQLLGESGCPWDKEQTPLSLTEYIVEETAELVDAIRSGDSKDICEELGDVMFLLLFLNKLLKQKNAPGLALALDMESDKMIRRHPHVFTEKVYESKQEQLRDWDKIKQAEKTEDQGVFASLPKGLTPLSKAYRIHAKAAGVGFSWPEDSDVEQQVEAEWLELLDAVESGNEAAIMHEYGDHLFSLVELGRRKGIKAALALDAANTRFLTRFTAMETLAKQRNLDFRALDLDAKDELWNEVKAAEIKGS